MLYTINLDENKFVLSLAHTKNDNVELDLTDVDMVHMNCYQYLDGKLVLNEEKLRQVIEEEEEQKRKEQEPTKEEKMDAQILYTALMTDTLLESEEE